MIMFERIFDVDIAFVTQQLTRGEQVLPFNAVSNINSIFHTNLDIRILFRCQKDQSPARLGNIRMTKKKHVNSTLTYHFFFTSLPEIFFNLAKRNNCFTRSFHAFSFESEFAGGRAFARGPLFSKKKKKSTIFHEIRPDFATNFREE